MVSYRILTMTFACKVFFPDVEVILVLFDKKKIYISCLRFHYISNSLLAVTTN